MFKGRDFKPDNFCSIHCRALKFVTHEPEEELEPIILLSKFQQKKVQNLFHTLLLGVFFVVFVFFLWFFDLVAKQTCLKSLAAHALRSDSTQNGAIARVSP